MTDFEVIKQAIGERHLQQLHNLNLVVGPLENYPIHATYDDLVKWTNASKTQIQTGTANCKYPPRIRAVTKFDETWATKESMVILLGDSSFLLLMFLRFPHHTRDLDHRSTSITRLWLSWKVRLCISGRQFCDLGAFHDSHLRRIQRRVQGNESCGKVPSWRQQRTCCSSSHRFYKTN